MKKLFNFIFYFSFLFLLSIKPSISEEKIKIGLLLPLSGQNSELGKSVLRSVNLAINKIDDPILEVYPKNNYDSPEKNYLAAKELYDKIREKIPDFNCEFKPDHRQEYADSWPNETDGTLSKEEWGFSLDFDLDSMCDVMIQSLRQ